MNNFLNNLYIVNGFFSSAKNKECVVLFLLYATWGSNFSRTRVLPAPGSDLSKLALFGEHSSAPLLW